MVRVARAICQMSCLSGFQNQMSLTSSDYLNHMEIKLEINCQLLPIYIDQTLRPVAAGVASVSVGSLCGLLQCPEANSLSGCHPYPVCWGMREA